MKKLFVAVLTFVLFFGHLGAINSDSKPGEKVSTFNVISYNIRLDTESDGINVWNNRKDKVTGLLRFHGADIFGLQEALPNQVADVVEKFPDFGAVGVGRDDGKSAGEHMMIFYRLSRFEKLDDGTFWLSETPEKPGFGWDAHHNRTVTWIKLKDKITQQNFYLFNTHFDHRGVVARRSSSQLLLTKIESINREGLPVVVTGDFNAIKENEPIQIILEKLIDSRTISQTAPYGPEYSSGGFQVKENSRIIDYIFVTKGINVVRHGILSDSFGTYYPSDHLAVLAEISL